MVDSNETKKIAKILGNPKVTFILGKFQTLKTNHSIGGPSSGKGTQAAKLVEEFGYKHLSVRTLISDEIAKVSSLKINNLLLNHCDVQGTKMGKAMAETVAQKELVDFKEVNQLVI